MNAIIFQSDSKTPQKILKKFQVVCAEYVSDIFLQKNYSYSGAGMTVVIVSST